MELRQAKSPYVENVQCGATRGSLRMDILSLFGRLDRGLSVSDYLHDYSQRTTAHGLRYVLSPEVPWVRRLTWMAVFLATLGYMMSQLISLYQSYYSYPFKTVSKVIPESSIPYPVVTLCNLNPVDSELLSKTSPVEWSRKRGFDSSKDVERIFSQFGPNSRRAHKSGELNINEEIMDINYQEFMINISRSVSETFTKCFWEGQEYRCDEIISRVFFDDMLCFQFNGIVGGGRVSTNYGDRGGFQAVFTVNTKAYVTTGLQDTGYKLYMHDDPYNSDSSTPSVFLSPGFTHHVSLQKHTYKFLPRPYMAFGNKYCRDPDAHEFDQSSTQYSVGACVSSRSRALATEKCNCSIENCTISQYLTCFKPTVSEMLSNASRADNFGCPQPCDLQDYEPLLSLSYFPVSQGPNKIGLNLTSENAGLSCIGLNLYFKDMIVRASEHVPELDIETLLGVLGGNMGLFLGISIVSLVEVCEFIVVLVCHFCMRNRNGSQPRGESTEIKKPVFS